MIRPIAPSLSPNTEPDDVALALKIILNPLLWDREKDITALEHEFSGMFGGVHAVAVNSGRSGLTVILKAMNLEKESEVVLQPFTCLVVPNAILANNLIPLYADIDDTYNIDARHLRRVITKKTRAVIVQHTFGVPADIRAIKKVIEEKEQEYKIKIYLIEDCAHSLGVTYQGKPTGTLGDAAFFSFGRDKIISSVFGGMILTKDGKLHKRIREIVINLAKPSKRWIIQQLLHPLLFSFCILPLYNIGLGKVTLGKLFLVVFQKLKMLSKPVYPDELRAKDIHLFPQQMPGALALLASHQLKKLERYNKRRQSISLKYFQSGIKPLSSKVYDIVFLRYPVTVENPLKIHMNARKHSLLLGNWYHRIIDPKCDLALFHYKNGSCPHAEELASQVINLPTYPTMSDNDVAKVINFIKSCQTTE